MSPATTSRSGSGAVNSRTYQTASGWVPIPFSVPRSHRSHHMTISGTRSMRGPGSADEVAACDHGPASSRRGTPFSPRRSIVRNVLLR
jgi:hypothetical protein